MWSFVTLATICALQCGTSALLTLLVTFEVCVRICFSDYDFLINSAGWRREEDCSAAAPESLMCCSSLSSHSAGVSIFVSAESCCGSAFEKSFGYPLA